MDISKLKNLNRFLALGMSLVFFCLGTGGILYLLNHGMEIYSVNGLRFEEHDHFPGAFFVKAGICVLLFVQLGRIAFVAEQFYKTKERSFLLITLLILLMIVATIIVA